ncbi:MAG: putative solute:sodium symporter small subunit [Phycisphaerales bacterium]|jgi:putative solute:sodium symporter small subunit
MSRPTDENTREPAGSPGSRKAYWHANLRIVGVLLFVWAFVSLGCGILFKDWLDRFTVPGTEFPLGFWFAQQGSIYVFVILIFVYVWLMNRLDRKYDVHEDDDSSSEASA